MPSAIYERWSVVVVPFPFTDMATAKKRPALVLSSADFQRGHDHLLCGMITSAAHSGWSSDVALADLQEAGLSKPSKFRCKLFTLHGDVVLYRLGSLSHRDRRAVSSATADLLPR